MRTYAVVAAKGPYEQKVLSYGPQTKLAALTQAATHCLLTGDVVCVFVGKGTVGKLVEQFGYGEWQVAQPAKGEKE